MTEESNQKQDYDAEIAQIESNLAKLEAVTAPIEDELKEIQKEYEEGDREFRAELEVIRNRMAEHRVKFMDKQNEKKDLLRKVLEKKRELKYKEDQLKEAQRKATEEAIAAANSAIIDARWANLMIAAPWREWAKDHQLSGAKQWAQNKDMLLADPMGLGKTLTAIMGTDLIKVATANASPDNPYEPDVEKVWIEGKYIDQYTGGVTKPSGLKILYICPSSLVQNVQQEFRHWAPHRSIVPIANTPGLQQDFAFQVAASQPEFVMLLNYEAWRKNFKLIDKLVDVGFDTLILDEAHYIKDMSTIFYRGVSKLVKEAHIPFILPMTGTPILNKPEDIYPMLEIIDPANFWSKNSFLNRYCVQDYATGKWVFRHGGVRSLGIRLGRKYLRREEDEAGIEIPEQETQYHLIDVDKEAYPLQSEARKTMRHNAFLQLQHAVDQYGNKKALVAAAQIAVYTRLRQIETWPAGIKLTDPVTGEVEYIDIEESQKMDYVLNRQGEGLLANILENQHRVVIFSQFTGVLKELEKRIKNLDRAAALLTGETSLEDRDIISKDFDLKHTSKDNFKYHVALCNYKVGGQGLNLTAARETIFTDEEWNPGKRDQAKARTRRIGQTEKTLVHVIRMKGTIDDWLAKLMSTKEELTEGFRTEMPSLQSFIDDTNESGLL